MSGSSAHVSVVIPTFNRSHMIGRAIRSVLAQTHRDWELIVVDDGSTDSTAEVVAGFPDARIRYERHTVNRGACAARNTGARLARGRYLSFLDSDSEWRPTKLERQLAAFENEAHGSGDIGVVLTGRARVEEGTGEKTVIRERPECKGFIERTVFLRKLRGGYMSALIKRECFFEAGMFDERLPACQDWDLCVRLSKICAFASVDEVLYLSYQHAGPRVHTRSNTLSAYKILFEKYERDFARHRHYHARLRCNVAAWCLAEGRRSEALQEAWIAVRLRPVALRPYFYLGLSVLGMRGARTADRLRARQT